MKPFNVKNVRYSLIISNFVKFLFIWIKKSSLELPVHSPNNILIFDFHLIGDIVLLLPFLKALKIRYPDSSLTLVAGPWAESILLGSNYISNLIIYSPPWVKKGEKTYYYIKSTFKLISLLRKTSWDLGIEMRGDIRQIFLLWLVCNGRRIGFNFTGGDFLLTHSISDDGTLKHIASHHIEIAKYLDAWRPNYSYFPEISLTNEELSRSNKIERFIGFHFGASLPLRRLPLVEIECLLNFFHNTNLPLIIFLSNDSISYKSDLLILVNKLKLSCTFLECSLRDFIITISRAAHMFVMDSGPAHISAALDIPTTVFFGPALPDYVKPLGKNISIIEKSNVECRPCNQVICINKTYQFCMIGLINSNKNHFFKLIRNELN